MAWYDGKDKLVILSFGDSNIGALATPTNTAAGLQTYNPNCFFWARDGSIPYVVTGEHTWQTLDHDNTSRLDERENANGDTSVEGLLYAGQVLGGHGCPVMQMADTLEQGTGLPVYAYGGYMGGATSFDWSDYLWSQLDASVTAAFAEIPGNPTAADVIYISTGGADLILSTPEYEFITPVDRRIPYTSPTAGEFYTNVLAFRSLMVSAGYWVPGTTQIVINEIPINDNSALSAYPAWQGLAYMLAGLNDRIAMVGGAGRTFDPAWTIHYSPQSYTDMGAEAGALVLAQIPDASAWFTGKSLITVGSIGDSNCLGSGGFTPPGGQSVNARVSCYASATGQVPYSESNLGWRNLDPNGTARTDEYYSYIATVGNIGYIGQALGGNGNSAMQMCDTVQQGAALPDLYLYQAAAGGTTANFWANLGGWDTLNRTIQTALDAIPGSPDYFDVLFFSLGTNDCNQSFTAEQFYTHMSTLRTQMIAAGWWIPGTTQIMLMDLPRSGNVTGYPGWLGLEYIMNRWNDRIGIISSVDRDIADDGLGVHYTPPSYTAIGLEAGEMLLDGLPPARAIVTLGDLRVLLGGFRLKAHGVPV